MTDRQHLRRFLLFFFASALAGFFGTGAPSDAGAAYRRYQANFCDARGTGANYIYNTNDGALWNYAGNWALPLYCPLIDDSTFPKSSVTQLNVHVYDGHTSLQVSAAACVQYYGSKGGACGTWASSGAASTGDVTLQPSVSVWQNSANAAHFPYVWVQLPWQQTGQSRLYGYYVQ